MQTCLVAGIVTSAASPRNVHVHVVKGPAPTVSIFSTNLSGAILALPNFSTAAPSVRLNKPSFVPKTPMGRAMMEARRRIVASGETLTPARTLMADLAKARGGF